MEQVKIGSVSSKLFSSSIPDDEVPIIIERHADSTEFKGVLYYFELMKAVTITKSHRSYLEKTHSQLPVYTRMGGELLYMRAEATEVEPYAIIGPSGFDCPSVLHKLKSLEGEVGEKFGSNLELYLNDLEKDGVEIIWRRHHLWMNTPNRLYVSYIRVCRAVGTVLKKNEEVFYIEFFDISSTTMTYLNKYIIAANYCREMINKLNNTHNAPKKDTKNVITPDKPIFLKDIFLEKFKYKYADIIKELAEDQCDEYPSPFIRIEGDKTIWETGITYSFSYLAGLFGALLKLGWIKEKKEGEFMQIAINTFHIEISLGRSAFQKMKTRVLDEAYINPFEDIFKRIK